MATKRLTIAKAKVHRAKAQIQNLDQEVRNFIGSNGYDVTTQLNLDGTEQIWRFRLRNKDTSYLSVLAGEIGHNLRTALDNLMCEIADQHVGRRDRTYFPFGKTLDILEGEIGRKTKDLPANAVRMIRSFKPYKGGNDLLWALHELNRDDKHPGIDALLNAQGMRLAELKAWNGKVLILGNRRGQHLTLEGYTPKFFAIARESEDYEFLTTTPGTRVETKIQPTFGVAFRDIEALQGKPIVGVLHQMRDLVEGIFTSFETKFCDSGHQH